MGPRGRLEQLEQRWRCGVSQQPSPRGTYLKIADAVKSQIAANEEMVELPAAAELMRDHRVSRGVALRVFAALRKEGLAEPVAGGRWRVVRPGRQIERRSLAELLERVITDDGLSVGERFPSTTELSSRFGVSRPTVSKALEKLESAGLLSEARQGKQRTVRALPEGTESPES
ncbi:GntR family transcriptional regulator [Streptomyces microflavus]|uniref:GntR family transcriptional regulator n=1 Tax=Streptomyces microflavus TaxID=1919 RepID=UPI0033B8C82B